MKNLLFVISTLSMQLALSNQNLNQNTSLERIQSMRFDKSKVERVYLAPGLGSMILFPCSLQEVFIGRNEDLKVQISPNDKKTLFLNLKLNSSLPTNVIAKCSPEKNVFIFDVIPNRHHHQDLVEIRGSFGRPSIAGAQLQQTTEIKQSSQRLVIKEPVLIKKGGRK